MSGKGWDSRESTLVVRVANNSPEGTRQPDVTSCVSETALIVPNCTHNGHPCSPFSTRALRSLHLAVATLYFHSETSGSVTRDASNKKGTVMVKWKWIRVDGGRPLWASVSDHCWELVVLPFWRFATASSLYHWSIRCVRDIRGLRAFMNHWLRVSRTWNRCIEWVQWNLIIMCVYSLMWATWNN